MVRKINQGDYINRGDDIYILLYLSDYMSEISHVTCGNYNVTVNKHIEWSETNNKWVIIIKGVNKSPQKIDIAIAEYIRYENIVQPYPVIVKIKDEENNVYSYGDKIKVGTKIKYDGNTNLLPQLYQVVGGIKLNDKNFNSNNTGVIEKLMYLP